MNTRDYAPAPSPLRAWILVVVAVCAVVGLLALAARAEPPNDASQVLRDAQGSISNTDGWCEALSTTEEDLWDSAPPRITSAIKGEVRFVEVVNIDSAIAICTMLGNNGNHAELADAGPGSFACDSSANEVGRIAAGSYRQFTVRRTKGVGGSSGATTELYAVAASGTPTVCVTVGW